MFYYHDWYFLSTTSFEIPVPVLFIGIFCPGITTVTLPSPVPFGLTPIVLFPLTPNPVCPYIFVGSTLP